MTELNAKLLFLVFCIARFVSCSETLICVFCSFFYFSLYDCCCVYDRVLCCVIELPVKALGFL